MTVYWDAIRIQTVFYLKRDNTGDFNSTFWQLGQILP